MNDVEMTTAGDLGGRKGTAAEVFAVFLKLGLTSFGGPIAHLGYFRDELVVRRRWIDEKGYADLVALCQFLPGPASSQVGFALGLLRGGPLGAAAAWIAFTLPSAILLVLFALGAALFGGSIGSGIIHGLKVVAVAIVAQAVWGMAKNLCPDRERASIALAALLIVVLVAGSIGQVAAIAAGGLAGLWLCRTSCEAITGHMRFPVSRAVGAMALVAFCFMLIGLPIFAAVTSSQGLAVFDSFYRAGSLVFGGGHVVLPLLETEVVRPGWVSANQFLAGYGAAQAVPGPLFTFAAYLGTVLQPEPNGLLGAAIALVAVFLPGFLLLIGIIPFWDEFRARAGAQALMRGANAAVVGILGAALYNPVWTSAIVGPYEFALAITCFVLLMAWKFPPWIVVIVAAAGGVLIGIV
ncbi:chromate transporter [Phyllobacterium phragmitis]|uniref:Chromate transporter n=1 Tax=Phyllobacterium phragmitis TaxID=2670329 RepID=A0A2S9IWJ1_9HYPH|nr:chromate efflux transporter [Phyllobacterium phragmitis]PRD44893.1 chromate transporter [Phyllobacterium phragmitis]